MESRKYTPISAVNKKGSIEFAIKIYRPTPNFKGGRFTSNLEMNVKVGDYIMCEGPFGKIKYKGYGDFELLGEPLSKKTNLGLIGGGTGITPLLSIA